MIMQIWTVTDPTRPNDSDITPAYVVVSPALVKRMRNSTETSAMSAMTTMSTKAGITPKTLRVAGIDMIPAPIMLVDTLKTAPESDARLVLEPASSGRRGTKAPAASMVAGFIS